MIIQIVAFNSLKELCEITHLENKDALQYAGFDIDDFDFGFQTNIPLHTEYTEDGYFEYGNEYMQEWLLRMMESYCVGPAYHYFEGMHYYLMHHS